MSELKDIYQVDSPPRNGACLGHDPKMWYPHASRREDGKRFSEKYKTAIEHTKIAKEICFSCPKQQECLNYGVYYEVHGIWGGRNERQREAIRRMLNIKLIVRETPLVVNSKNWV